MRKRGLTIPGVVGVVLMFCSLEAGAGAPSSMTLQPSDDADGWYGPVGWTLDDPEDAVADPLDDILYLKRLGQNPGGPYVVEGEYRAAMEFDMSGLPTGAAVISARLKLMSGDPNNMIGVYGYAGDGVVTAADLAVAVQTLTFNHNPGLNQVDVTGLVQSLVSSGEDYAGFALREETDDHFAIFDSMENTNPPELVIEYVPEAGTLLLLAAAGAALVRRRG